MGKVSGVGGPGYRALSERVGGQTDDSFCRNNTNLNPSSPLLKRRLQAPGC